MAGQNMRRILLGTLPFSRSSLLSARLSSLSATGLNQTPLHSLRSSSNVSSVSSFSSSSIPLPFQSTRINSIAVRETDSFYNRPTLATSISSQANMVWRSSSLANRQSSLSYSTQPRSSEEGGKIQGKDSMKSRESEVSDQQIDDNYDVMQSGFQKLSKEEYEIRDAWEEFKDEQTGEMYYYNYISKQRQAEKPPMYLPYNRVREPKLLTILRSDRLNDNPYAPLSFWYKVYWALFVAAMAGFAIHEFVYLRFINPPVMEKEQKRKRKKRQGKKKEEDGGNDGEEHAMRDSYDQDGVKESGK